MRIVFTGGGTGGHIFPLVAVARQLNIKRDQIPDGLEMYFIGPNGFSKDILEKEGIRVKIILAGKLRRYFSFWTIIDFFKTFIGFIQSLVYLFFLMPDVIFSKGSYGAIPPVIVSWLYRVPILIHESDAVPGLANRLNAKMARKIAYSFASTAKYFPSDKSALVGNPIRLELAGIDIEGAKKILNIAGQKPVILILGGSQGARIINEVILKILPDILGKYEIIHQTGKYNYQEIKQIIGESQSAGYYLFDFLNEEQLKASLALSDLIISRAGSSIFEIALAGKPSILIPLPSAASDHQRENAFSYAEAGATIVLEQDNLTPHLLLSEIDKIMSDLEISQAMSQAAKKFSRLEAGEMIAEEIIKLGA